MALELPTGSICYSKIDPSYYFADLLSLYVLNENFPPFGSYFSSINMVFGYSLVNSDSFLFDTYAYDLKENFPPLDFYCFSKIY